jgi:putative two-component system response regulator
MNILLLDNDEKNLAFFQVVLKSAGHTVVKMHNPDETLALLANREKPVDMVFLALVMPGVSGPEIVKKIKAERDVPVLLLAGLREKEDILAGIRSGADEFLFKPFLEEEILLKVANIGRCRRDDGDGGVEKRAGNLRKILRRNMALNREMVFRLLAAAEYKDDVTDKHIIRVGKYSRAIAEELGFRGEFLDLVESAASMHDIGKIGIPDRMLFKPGKLSTEEFEIMKSHTVIGAAILEGSTFPLLNMAHDVALTHHERWDGTGYPHRKKGDAIPVTGRIVALADIFDALTSARPYKPAYAWERSLIIIKEGRGKLFDPAVTDVFLGHTLKIEGIFHEYRDAPDTLLTTNIVDTIDHLR